MKMKLLPLITLAATIAPFALAQEATPGEHLGLRGAEPALRSEPSVSIPTENPATEYPRPGTPAVTPKPKAAPPTPAPSPTPTPTAKRDVKPAKPKATSSPVAKNITPAPVAKREAKPKASSAPAAKKTPPALVAKRDAKPAKPKAASSPVVKKSPPAPVAKPETKPKPQPENTPIAKSKSLPASVRGMETAWAAATEQHDVATIQSLLAVDYVGVTASGQTATKAGLLADLKKDKNVYESVVNSQLDVREYGNAAVVIGTTKQKGKNAAGQSFSYTYRWVDTWVKRDGQWQCVASQSLRLRG